LATERQIAANRQNAQHSSGPRTPEGKAASGRNAVKHGLTARNVLLAGEDPAEYRHLHEAAIASLKPEGELERELVARIVSVLWRLRRAPVFEAALLALLKEEEYHLFGSDESTDGADLELGRTIKEFLSADYSGKLSRYETSLQKQLSALLKELRAVQADGKDSAQASPR
jgi:hypothetical protein